ncbi:uncharacterized protein LOC132196326 [Neocloeon triangulifer]|uniref:uncharacterized protein LOC132196326 n=1 Tax=Neocloeon triangulifer TaxID=2078957 RepID=UPI00286F4C9E|nr:uncharacterized protein LOC132196326 [Neocloeon triangulifer]
MSSLLMDFDPFLVNTVDADKAADEAHGASAAAKATAAILNKQFAGMRINHYGDEHGTTLPLFIQSIKRTKYSCPGITEGELVNLAISNLTGAAFDFATELKTEGLTLEKLKKALADKFEQAADYLSLKSSFERLKQEEWENVKQFYLRLEAAANRMLRARNPHAEETENVKKHYLEEEMKRQFFAGLHDNIATALQISSAETLEDMLKTAIKFEAGRRQRKSRSQTTDLVAAVTEAILAATGTSSVSQQQTAPASAASQQQQQHVSLQQLLQQQGAQAAPQLPQSVPNLFNQQPQNFWPQMQAPLAQHSVNYAGTPPQQQGRRNSNAGGNQPRNLKGGKCFRCGQFGHMVKDCQKPCSYCFKPGHSLGAAGRTRSSNQPVSAKKLAAVGGADAALQSFLNIHAVQPRPGRILWVQRGRVRIPMMVDSGSAITILRYDLAKRLGLDLKPCHIKFGCANGTGMQVRGSTDFKFTVLGRNITHTCVVVDVTGVGYQALLGLDFLHQHQAVSDHAHNRLHFPWATAELDANTGHLEAQVTMVDKRPERDNEHELEFFPVVAPRDELVRELSCTAVEVVSGLAEGTDVLVLTESPGVSCPAVPMVTKVERGGRISILLSNPETSPFLVKAGKIEGILVAKIGTDYKIEEEEVEQEKEPKPPDPPAECENLINLCTEEERHEPPFLPNPVGQPLTDEQRLAQFDFNGVDPEHLPTLKALILKNIDVFAFSDSQLGCTDMLTHKIDTGNAEPVKIRPYRVPMAMREVMEAAVRDMRRQGVIEPANSPWSAPMIMVARRGPDGEVIKYRPCIDWRGLNAVTKKRVYPLPHIQDVLDSLQGSKFFSTLDLDSGYWQIPMDEASKEKTAFSTPFGQFQCLRMGFGLVNGPSDFSALMDAVFRNKRKGVVNYMDDVVAGTALLCEHWDVLQYIFDRLREAKLKLKPAKCFFLRQEVSILGHRVSALGSKPDNKNVQAIVRFPVPTEKRALRSWVGMVNYFRRYIPKFSGLIKVLTDLLKEDEPFVWNEERQTAFEHTKALLHSEPLLRLPDMSKPFVLSTDASGFALGAALEQDFEDGRHPVGFASQKLKKAELNYHTTERECLAVLFGVRAFDVYLRGRHFILQTDHECLKWLLSTSRVKGGKLARWAVELAEYDFTVQVVPGSKNTVADALSRVEINSVMQTTQEPAVKDEIAKIWDRKTILAAQKSDSHCSRVMSTLKNAPEAEISPYFVDQDGLLYFRDLEGPRLCVPEEMRPRVLEVCHNLPTGAHKGGFRMFYDIRKRFYWPGWHRDVRQHCVLCMSCVQKKGKNMQPVLNRPVAPVVWRLQRIAIDVKGPLPLSKKRNRYILTFVDHFTHYPEAAAVANTDAPTVAWHLVDKIISRYGVPLEMLTDRGTNFTSAVIAAVAKLLKMKQIFTSPYHPEGNGLLERSHQTYGSFINQFCSNGQGDWEENLPFALMAIRTSPNRTTQTTPSMMMLGRDIELPWEDITYPKEKVSFHDAKDPSVVVDQLRARLATTHAAALQFSEEAKEAYTCRGPLPSFSPGDLVLRKEMRPGKKGKDGDKWRGPYVVLHRRSDVTYDLKLLNPDEREQVECTVHVSHLRPKGSLAQLVIGAPFAFSSDVTPVNDNAGASGSAADPASTITGRSDTGPVSGQTSSSTPETSSQSETQSKRNASALPPDESTGEAPTHKESSIEEHHTESGSSIATSSPSDTADKGQQADLLGCDEHAMDGPPPMVPIQSSTGLQNKSSMQPDNHESTGGQRQPQEGNPSLAKKTGHSASSDDNPESTRGQPPPAENFPNAPAGAGTSKAAEQPPPPTPRKRGRPRKGEEKAKVPEPFAELAELAGLHRGHHNLRERRPRLQDPNFAWNQ